jgi:hypothetical protein
VPEGERRIGFKSGRAITRPSEKMLRVENRTHIHTHRVSDGYQVSLVLIQLSDEHITGKQIICQIEHITYQKPNI